MPSPPIREVGKVGKDSLLGNLGETQSESAGIVLSHQPFKYVTKLEFPRFNGEGIDEWLFKVEQFFVLDKTLEQSRLGVVALHLEDNVLHWHENYIKKRRKCPSFGEYLVAMKAKFGPVAYEDPMVEIKKLRQTGSLHDYLKAFDILLDKVQLDRKSVV